MTPIRSQLDHAAAAPGDRRLFARGRDFHTMVRDVVPGSAPILDGGGLRAKSAGIK
jgi:hypothetical protein